MAIKSAIAPLSPSVRMDPAQFIKSGAVLLHPRRVIPRGPAAGPCQGVRSHAGGSVYRRSSYTCADRRSLRFITRKTRERARPSAPAIMRITPMTWRSTWAGFQVTPNRRIAPTTPSTPLPPIVTAFATPLHLHSARGVGGTPRPARVTRAAGADSGKQRVLDDP